jgi:delta1-piperideine-2-carboxylate reductase
VADAAPGLVRVDAHSGFAAPALVAGRRLLVQKAKAQGVAALALHRSRHFHALWWEVEALADEVRSCAARAFKTEKRCSCEATVFFTSRVSLCQQGLVVLAMANSAAFVALPGGGARPVFGTNPLAFGCPRGDGRPPLVFDQACALMARGEIQLLQRAGLPLPPGAAVDAAGLPTTDAAAGLAGAQLPFGGHKGANLALMVELLAAACTGSPFAAEASAESHPGPEAQGAPARPLGGFPTVNGELVLALDPEQLSQFGGASPGGFRACVEEFLLALLSGSAGPQGSAPRLPSDRRYAQRQATMARAGAIEVDSALFDAAVAFGNNTSVQ